MKHFISTAGQLHAYEEDGSQDHLIPADSVPATDEQVNASQNPALTPEQVRNAAISKIESQITPRRLREAVLGTDGGWLANAEAQIAALR
jgi:hypothetical protein